MIKYGENYGKVAVIVDIVDDNRVLMDGPTTGIAREIYPVKHIALTGLKFDLFKGARTGTVKKAADKFDLENKWNETTWAKKIARKNTRANLTDFERFTVMVQRKRKAFLLRQKK